MSMLDLNAQAAEADGRLVKVAMSRDGADEEAYVYEAQVAFSIKDYEDCALVSHLLPGAREVFDRANAPDDNVKFTSTTQPDISGLRVILSHATGGKVAIEGGAEIRSAKLVASKKAVTCTLKLAFGGQTAGTAAGLVALLGNPTCVSVSRDQQSLFAVRPAATGPRAEVGCLVTARENGDVIVGRVTVAATDDDSTVVLEDFDAEYRVNEASIVSVINLTGDVAALRRSYKDRAKRKGVSPTWNAILLAIAETFDGARSGGGTFELTAATIKRAADRLDAGAGDELPPEPTPQVA